MPISIGERASRGISVIIPTTCEAKRGDGIRRAIRSVLQQKGVDIDLIVVVNGGRYCPVLFRELKKNPALRVHYRSEGNLPAALRFGRSLVSSKYFSFLDDDDEYLPDCMTLRFEYMEEHNDCDVVVTNGYTFAGEDKIRLPCFGAAANDPLNSLLRENWLASCGGLFRASTISIDYFDGKTKYSEWTMLAFRLVVGKRRIAFLNTPTYRVHNTPDSESKSDKFRLSAPGFLEYMLTFDLPRGAARKVRKKLAAALHDSSAYYLQMGDYRCAWRFHVRSLYNGGLARYLFYTRKLLMPQRNK